MMRTVDPFLAEFDHETAVTRRLFDQVPQAKFGWRPHDRAMSLGELCAHVARIPGTICDVLAGDGFDVSAIGGDDPPPATHTGMMALFDENVKKARAFLDSLDDDRAAGDWRLTKGDKDLMSMPRIAAVRSFLFNHLYHHRGQIAIYLRIADERVPSIYGPTADENPFD